MRRVVSTLLGLFMVSGMGWAQTMQPGTEGLIPVVTATPGAAGSFWQSDVWITNVTGETVDVELWVWTGGKRDDSVYKHYDLEAHASLGVADVVGDLGLEQGHLYLLNFDSSGDVVVGSRTYTAAVAKASGGTFGQFIPSFAYNTGFSGGSTAVFPVPLDPGQVRDNVGVANAGWSDATATITVYDGSGTAVSSKTVSVPHQSVVQANLVNQGLDGAGNGSIEVAFDGGDPAQLYPYVSVVDFQGTSDPSFLFTLP